MQIQNRFLRGVWWLTLYTDILFFILDLSEYVRISNATSRDDYGFGTDYSLEEFYCRTTLSTIYYFSGLLIVIFYKKLHRYVFIAHVIINALIFIVMQYMNIF